MTSESDRHWHRCIVSNDVAGFLLELERRWRASNKRFKLVQLELVSTLEEYKTLITQAALSQADDLMQGQSDEPRPPHLPDKWEDPPPTLVNRENRWKPTNAPLTGTAAALCHLLLESVPPPLSLPSDVAAPEVQEAAGKLFNLCLERRNARLAVKVAACYGLSLSQQEDREILRGTDDGGSSRGIVDIELLRGSVQDMLDNKHLVGPAVALLMRFPGLPVCFSAVEAMLALISDGQLTTAQKWAAELGAATQEELVEACIREGNLRDACFLVKEWEFTEKFPNLESQYQQRTMQRLLGKSLWSAAAGFAIGNPAFQRQLVTALAVDEEHALADAYCLQFGLDPEGLPLQGEALAESRAARDAAFHQLTLDADRVHFVDTNEDIAMAKRSLQDVELIGLDVEWRPDKLGQKSPASIIQIATIDSVFIFDLVALHREKELDNLLMHLFQKKNIVKLSMDGSQDLKKLAGITFSNSTMQNNNFALNAVDSHFKRPLSKHSHDIGDQSFAPKGTFHCKCSSI